MVPVGGHNLLEPILEGRPVLFGPYIENARERAVWTPVPGEVASDLKSQAPVEPSDPSAVYDEFLEKILPYNLHTNHPRFWAWYMGSGNVMGALADFLAAVLNPNVGGISHVAP